MIYLIGIAILIMILLMVAIYKKATSGSKADELKKFAQLKENGALTEDEYAKVKAKAKLLK